MTIMIVITPVSTFDALVTPMFDFASGLVSARCRFPFFERSLVNFLGTCSLLIVVKELLKGLDKCRNVRWIDSLLVASLRRLSSCVVIVRLGLECRMPFLFNEPSSTWLRYDGMATGLSFEEQ